jgi:hypothetical protein
VSYVLSTIALMFIVSSLLFERGSGTAQFLSAFGLGLSVANMCMTHAAPAENLPSGKTGSPLPGAAVINPARVAAAGTANRQNSAGRDVAGEE